MLDRVPDLRGIALRGYEPKTAAVSAADISPTRQPSLIEGPEPVAKSPRPATNPNPNTW